MNDILRPVHVNSLLYFVKKNYLFGNCADQLEHIRMVLAKKVNNTSVDN